MVLLFAQLKGKLRGIGGVASTGKLAQLRKTRRNVQILRSIQFLGANKVQVGDIVVGQSLFGKRREICKRFVNRSKLLVGMRERGSEKMNKAYRRSSLTRKRWLTAQKEPTRM
jgi:hypothetical protein